MCIKKIHKLNRYKQFPASSLVDTNITKAVKYSQLYYCRNSAPEKAAAALFPAFSENAERADSFHHFLTQRGRGKVTHNA